MRRVLACLTALILVAGCSSESHKIDEHAARRAAHDAWGEGFESNRYDLLRQLGKDEQKKLDADLSEKAGRPLHATGTVFTANIPPDRIVDEIHRLEPGCALSFCRTWHVEKKSGDVIESGTKKPAGPVPFSIISRDPDGKLHASRFEATSHEEALSRR